MPTRLLNASDSGALETFLAKHRDSSMTLRSNARAAGLEYQERPFHGHYVAAFRGSEMIAVACHAWSGMLVLQVPECAAEVSRAVVATSGRKVTGLLGPCAHVRSARSALGLTDAATRVDNDDGLYALELSELAIPESLTKGIVVCRAPESAERDTLCEWRAAYDIEVLGSSDSPEMRARSRGFLDSQIAEGSAWVATENGALVSLSAFNARLPDMVQLGGIYTPPSLRGRGYARAAIAASLQSAREQGVTRAVLFANHPSALRCYESLGFRLVGEFGLVLFA